MSNDTHTKSTNKVLDLSNASDIKIGDVKFGDVTQIGTQVVQSEPKFYQLKSEAFVNSQFISPSNQLIDNLSKIIQEQNLLILCGGNDVDKLSIARYFAWELSKRNEDISIWEWQRNSNPQTIDAELEKQEEQRIYLLSQVSPQNLGYDLSRIKKATNQKHFVIITTETPQESWKSSEEEEHFWYNLSQTNLYDSEQLFEFLVKEINKAGSETTEKFNQPPIQSENLVTGNISYQTIVDKLETPAKISRFLQILEQNINQDNQTLEQLVPKLLEEINNNETSLNKWYYQVLDSREKLLALGLSLFEGLLDDQFFAALEEVVENVWQKRDPSLRALDYCDLDNLRNFFNFSPISAEDEELIIESRLPYQRRTLFKVAWNSHRRQILAALPTIAIQVRKSVNNRSFDKELYGTEDRCRQIRRVVAETLSDVGWVSPASVEESLQLLAADEAIEIQAVAADAMSRWRDPNYQKDQELFNILDSWQHNNRFISQIKSIIQERDSKQSQEPEDYIRATIALTVGYAALYDPPNKLDERLYNLIETLSKDKNSLVRDRFSRYTLPSIIPLHLVQLRELLKKMTQQNELVPGIFASMVKAHKYIPTQVLETLERWYYEKENKTPSVNLLQVVVLTYGHIECEQEVAKRVVRQLHNFLKKSTAPYREKRIRSEIIHSIGLQLNRYFSAIEPLFREIIKHIETSERYKIIDLLTVVYLKQRGDLQGSDRTIEINKKTYPIWLDISKRPKTPVEEAMISWLQDSSDPLLQEIATQASVNFAVVLDQEEERQIRRIINSEPRTKQSTYLRNSTVPLFLIKPQQNFYLGKLIPRIVTRNNPDYQLPIGNLLPEAWRHKISRSNAMDFVIRKWKKEPNNNVVNIANFLQEGFWYAKYLGILVGSFFVILIIILLAYSNSAQQNRYSSNQLEKYEEKSDNNLEFTEEKATDLVKKWISSKQRIFGEELNRSIAAELLTGIKYEQTLGEEGSLDYLAESNSYYTYQYQKINSIEDFYVEENEAMIKINFSENRTMCQNDLPKSAIADTNLVTYYLYLDENSWKIAETEIETISESYNDDETCN